MERAARQALAHADRSARRTRGNGRSHTRSVGGGRRSDPCSGGDSRVRAARQGRGSTSTRWSSVRSRPCGRCSARSTTLGLFSIVRGTGTGTDAWAVSDDGSWLVPRERGARSQVASSPRSGSCRMRWSLPEPRASATPSLKPPHASRSVALQRDPARAEALATLSRDNAPAESIAAQALARVATARVTASRARAEATDSEWKPFASCRLRCRTSAQTSWWSWPRFSGQAETRPGRRDDRRGDRSL